MKQVIALLIALLVIGCSSNKVEKKENEEQAVRACEKLIADFQSALKPELMTAMTNGGPENAVRVCNTKAYDIAQEFSALPGVELRRVSLKQRNPRYMADDFETLTLKTFEAEKSNKLRIFKEFVTDRDGTTRFRYMKEIKTGSMCLTCHGDPNQFSDGLRNALAELYPNDSAIGYQAGDSRGAFSVILTYPDAKASIGKLLGKPAK